ncbi:MAG: glutathione-disulfide reductase, partial [Rhodospirillales bacterium]
IAAQSGAKVGICEDSRVGGTCVIRGCVPKKLLVYGSHFAEDFEDAAGYGWTIGERKFDWPTLIANKDREIDRLNLIYKKLLSDAAVTLHEARGRLVDEHTVDVGGTRHTAKYIVIATGGYPVKPPIVGAELAITSNEAFHLTKLPPRIVVVGGGYIAVEFAGIFNGLGAEVTQVIRRETVLRGFDEEVRSVLQKEMTKKGVIFRSQTEIVAIEKGEGFLRCRTAAGEAIEADAVMYATGRDPNTKNLGLEEVGVTLNKAGAIAVDEGSQSTVPSIYAIGDVTDRVNLTPVAIMEGHYLANTLFHNQPMKPDHANVPSAVFSQPGVATVGLSEEQARRTYGKVDVYASSFRPMKYTLSGRQQHSFMKLVVDAKSDKVVGAHMVGDDAAEIIQGLAVAIKAGATKKHFDTTVGIHPTAAEEFVTMRTKRAAPQGTGATKAAE